MTVKITITFADPVDPEAVRAALRRASTRPLVRRAFPGLRGYEYGRALVDELRRQRRNRLVFRVVSLTFDSEEAMHAVVCERRWCS